MKALLLKKYMELEVTDLPKPEIGPEDVLVRVRACGICGSDVHGLDGSTGRRIPPLVMGHEAAGVIAEVGRDVKEWKEGDRVTFDSTVSCGRCSFCRRATSTSATTARCWASPAATTAAMAPSPSMSRFPQNILLRAARRTAVRSRGHDRSRSVASPRRRI